MTGAFPNVAVQRGVASLTPFNDFGLVHPGHRGRGLGAVVTAGTIHRIADRCAVIGLNVSAGNSTARVIYERLGFRTVLDYDEVVIL